MAAAAVGEEKKSALKKKTDNAKKSEILREIHKLEVQIQALERERSTHIFSKRSDFRQDFALLEEEDGKLFESRKTEKIRLRQQLEKMSHMVKRFQRELREVKPTPEFVEKLKSIMEEIEETTNTFKEQQRTKYEDIMKTEKILSQEVQQLESKFDSWTQLTSASNISGRTNTPKPVATARDVTKDLPPEVAGFDKFVHQSGGHRGGWDEYDHQTFMRYRNMYKGRIVFLDHLKPMLPTRTESEIREHESWYQEYSFLLENKKCAIKKWREKKEEDKEDCLTEVQQVLEQESKEKEKVIDKEALAKEKSERLKQINAYKVQKELERAMKEERKLKEEIEKKRKQEEDRLKQKEVKRKVDEFKKQRELEEEMLELIKEERRREEQDRRREMSARELGRFRNRDMRKLDAKLEKEREMEEKRIEKERRLEALKNQVHVEVDRDPDRLLKPTAGWKERLKKKKEGGKQGGQVYHMPHRAQPSWRQGLS